MENTLAMLALSHRRYFTLTDGLSRKLFGEVMDDFIDEDAIKKHGLDDRDHCSVHRIMTSITTGVKRYSQIPWKR